MLFEARASLADLVPENGLFIELGVARGAFAAQVMARHPTLRYIGIDKWNDHHTIDEMQQAAARLEPWLNRAVLWHRTFADALPDVPDESVCLVYIDGYAHTGQDGGRTLRDWWVKVKPGGHLAGHDYAARFQPTINAVDDFATAHALPVRVIDEPKGYASWVIHKPATWT